MVKKLVFIFFLNCFYLINAQKAFIPEPTLKVISDFENLLSPQEIEELASHIKNEYNNNSNQLMVLCIPTSYVGGLSIEDYAQKVFEKWQPGQKNLDNGVLMIISGSMQDSIGRKLRIQTGYGLEAVLPDLLCARIEREVMVPELKKGNYFKAIKNGCSSILNIITKVNVGFKPLSKIKIENNNSLLYDYAQLYTTEQKISLEKELNRFFNTNKNSIITTIDNSLTQNNIRIVSRTSSKYDTTLINVRYNPGYFFDTNDSLLKFDNNKKCYEIEFTTKFSKYYHLRYDKLYEQSKKLNDEFNSNKIFEITINLIEEEKIGYQSDLKIWLKLASVLVLLFLIIYFINYGVNKSFTIFEKSNKLSFLKVIIGILLSISNLYAYVSLCTLEILWILILSFGLELNFVFSAIIFVLLATTQLLSLKFVSQINKNYFNSKLFNWLPEGGGAGGYSYSSKGSSSSYKSSSSSSSSRSYSSSSSNSGYSGGGGRSCGGGASSSW